MTTRWPVSIALIVAAFAAIVWWTEPFLLLLFGIITLWVSLPMALLAAVLLWYANKTGFPRPAALTLLYVTLGLVCFVGLAIPTNYFVQEYAVAVAKAYPARVAPLLEAYRQAHGAYPTNLDQLPSKPSLPGLMRGFGYHSDGRSYYFSFPQPGGLIDVWSFDSRTGTWHLST